MSEPGAAEATTHLVAHLLRDIESAIRDVLLPEGYVKPKAGKGGHAAEIDAILKAYEVGDADPVAVAWRKLAGEGEEVRLHRLAHRSALGQPRRLDDQFRNLVSDIEAIFDVVLERFETRFLESFKVLDNLLEKERPEVADAELLRGRVPNNPMTLDYFFSKPQAERWLDSLATAGFFRQPPEPIRDEEEGLIRFPPWPESRYLVRMAAKPPLQERVAEVALAIPDTANVIVQEDLVDVALALPARLAARFLPKVRAWLRSPQRWIRTDKLGQLISYLARGGEVAGALELAALVLTVEPDPRGPIQLKLGGKERLFPPELRTPFDLWLYEEVLKRDIPDLIDAAGLAGLDELGKLLETAIRLSRSHPDEGDNQDYSYIWRPAIEDHPQNHPHTLKDALVTAVRDAVERLARRDPAQVPDIVRAFEGKNWLVFRRLALHLLRLFPETARPLIAERVTDRTVFEEHGLWHEYVLLLKQEFPNLSPAEQATILAWIEAGPDVDRYQAWVEKETGNRPSAEDVDRYRKDWRLRRLAPLREVLPQAWQEHADQLAADLGGQPEHPEFVSYSSGGWFGVRAVPSRRKNSGA